MSFINGEQIFFIEYKNEMNNYDKAQEHAHNGDVGIMGFPSEPKFKDFIV
jgi:hypothetical protein